MKIENNYYDKETNTLLLNKNHKIMLKTIKETVTTSFYMTAITEEENNLLDMDIIPERLENFLTFHNLYANGDGNEKRFGISHFKPILQREDNIEYSTVNNKKQIKEYYRNYEKSEENWKKTKIFINHCEDATMSWQSALRKLGAKKVKGLNNKFIPFYVVVWHDKIN